MHEAVTLIATYTLIIPVLAYLLLIYYQRKDLKRVLVFTFFSALIATILIKIATTVHSDPRPFVRDGVTPYFKSAMDNGFPSDHTALSSVIAAIVFVYHKAAGAMLAVVALVIGAARVIGGVHHAQDVASAFAIAIIAVYLAQGLTKVLLAKLNNKTTPET